MTRVVFLVYHGMGHVNASLKPAKILERDYEVYFAGVEFFKNYVHSQNLKYYTLNTVPFGLGFETWVNTIKKSKWLYYHTLRYRWRNVLFFERQKELTKMIEELAPDTVLIDSLQSTDFIVLYPILKKHGVKVAFYNTMPSTVLKSNNPPVNSLVFPHDKTGMRKAVFNFKFRKLKKSLRQKIRYFWKDDQELVRWAMIKNDIPEYYSSSLQTPLGVVFRNIPEVILMPREFEFPEYEPLPSQHYSGFMLHKTRYETNSSISELEPLLSENSRRKLIYCSFGTVEPKNIRRIKSFIERLIAAVASAPYNLIISLPTNFESIRPDESYEHVYFLKSVPQLKVLSHADAFITHGGLNSIKESIHAEVPILVYPVDPNFDQRSNSTRVVYHTLGLRGNLNKDTAQMIRNKIEDLLMNPAFKENIQKMKRIDEGYSDERFLFLFQTIRPLSNNF